MSPRRATWVVPVLVLLLVVGVAVAVLLEQGHRGPAGPHPGPSVHPTVPSGAPSGTPSGPGPHAPSGVPVPTGDLPGGWHQAFAEDFRTDVPVGSFPGKVYGARWRAYPDGWHDTTGNGTYAPSRTLSVRDGALDIYLHTEDGEHLVAAPLPRLPEPNTYGRYSVRFRADPVPGYKIAWLLWPDSDDWPEGGEIDFPEGNLDATVSGHAHHADPEGGQDSVSTEAPLTTWHTATTVWEPGRVTFELDGAVVGTSTEKVPDEPMHWVLQTETATNGTVPEDDAAGHVRIDWVSFWRKDFAAQ